MPYLRVKNELPLIPGYAEPGSVVTFNDGAVAPLNRLNLTVDANAGGISSIKVYDSGKNLINVSETYTINAGIDRTLNIGNVYLKAGKTYAISCKQTPASLESFVRNIFVIVGTSPIYNPEGNDYTIKPMIFTPSVSGIYSVRIWGNRLSADTNYSEFQVEESSSPTAYEAYSGDDYSISLGQSYTDGGILDVVSGIFIPEGESPVQLTPTQVNAVPGFNYVYADCGDINELTYIRRLDS